MIKDINVIVAIDKNYGIGLNGKLPWHIPEELSVFKTKTWSSIVIVGTKTFNVLPKLFNRDIYRVSRGYHPLMEENNIFPSFEAAYEKAKKSDKKIFVIGGASLYEYVLNKYKDKIILHLSIIDKIYECDTFINRKTIDNFYILKEEAYVNFNHYILTHNKNGEQQYINIIRDVLNNGDLRETRNGNVLSLFGKHMKFDLRESFPLLTTKKMFTKGIIEELLFFMRGQTQSKILENNGINIWKPNTTREFLDENGFVSRQEGIMGPMYGFQWRHFNGTYDEETGTNIGSNGIDQLKELVDTLKSDPSSRRILLTSYNPSQVKNGVLFPCHSVIIQFYVTSDNYLDMFCYNRSSDIGLGLPFNIASSSLLLMIIAQICGYKARYFHLSLGDAHIYEEHVDVLSSVIDRIPYKFPRIKLPENLKTLEDINNVSYKDFEVKEYVFHPVIKMLMKA